jgi:hypothetical protein
VAKAVILAQDSAHLELVRAENRLHSLFLTLYTDSLANTDTTLEQILEIMPEALVLPGSMEYPWNQLDRIGVITSDDGMLRIFTWHVEDDPDHYSYFGYLQIAGKRDRIYLFPLTDNGQPQRGIYKLDQSPEDWYGKLYYGILTRKVKRKTYYTLLGMDFNDSRSNMKTAEVLMIQRNKPHFLKEMFFNGRDRVDRLILEYSDQVAISLRFDPRLKMIAFDHLVPFHPIYKNNFEFYGPDGSFDGLEFEGGIWILREDIDARLEY